MCGWSGHDEWLIHSGRFLFIYAFVFFLNGQVDAFLFYSVGGKGGEDCCGGFGDGVEIKNKIQTKKALLQMLMLLWWHECWMQGRRSWARFLFFSFFAFGVCWLFFFWYFKKKKAHCENMSLSGASHTNSKGPTQNPRYIISSSLSSLSLSRCGQLFIYLTFCNFFIFFFSKKKTWLCHGWLQFWMCCFSGCPRSGKEKQHF